MTEFADPSAAALSLPCPSPPSPPSLFQRGLRLLGWLALAALALMALVVTLLRYVILPQVGAYKAEIEAAASGIAGRQVSIGRIDARWQGLNPDLVLADVRLLDAAGEPVFTLARVESVFSWQSLWRWRPVLALLAFDGPVLHVRRDGAGHITIADIPATVDGDTGFTDWALAQKRIRIRDATIVWDDQLRGAPPLVLEDLQFGLDNRGRTHRFGLSALPPKALADRLDLRGEITGDPADALEQLAGKLFVQLDYADLAGWRAWLDYPVDLPQGRGALRVWGDLADGGGALTADLALEDLRLRLKPDLPELDLDNLRGRLAGRYQNGAWSLRGEKLELLTNRGARIAPTDFTVEWTQKPSAQPGGNLVDGKASASFIDLGVLAALAEYLPLDERSRQLLRRHRPQGQVAELRVSWGLADETLQRYAVKAAFTGLGMRPGGYFPGGSGLGGRVDMNEKGGDLRLDNGRSSLSLPAVFPEAEILLDTLRAEAQWTVNGEEIAVRLPRLEFASPDAAGAAHGSYRFTGAGPGVIDLEASVTRAVATAAWRYMPHVVNADARAWLRRGLTGGRAYDGKLALKGNLADFPFADGKSGQFSVTARVADGRVDYADGWPLIEGIDADLEFGVGMKITAHSGHVLGARLSGVTAVMPDFNAADERLLVRGGAAGPTGEFLGFIAKSPVAASIDHFTDGFTAKGDGLLDLELDLPVRRLAESRVRGHYRLRNNDLEVIDGLPPLLGVGGAIDFTESSVTAQNLAGRLFGGPFKAQIGNVGGKIKIEAGGVANIAEAGKHFTWPLAGRLSGSSAWRAAIGIDKGDVQVVVNSDLIGITSALPPPLNKGAAAPLPLRLEQTRVDGGEQFRLSLGALAGATLTRRAGNWERGVLALGESEVKLLDKTPDKTPDKAAENG
ncbi:MAG: TIGR02099 family protein, partial [Azonexus sp.]|nr:TIGR02099 family protein [Azonexus sp.]